MQSASGIIIDLQLACSGGAVPAADDFRRWAAAALAEAGAGSAAEITVRVVDADESRALNRDYRDKDRPTNVLSFPSDLPDFLRAELDPPPLGDLVICAPVVREEALAQGKAEREHWAHLTVHGVLHLLGFDHVGDAEADIMEAHEITALAALGMNNPYETDAE
jgi:probable rRNA maturation factor